MPTRRRSRWWTPRAICSPRSKRAAPQGMQLKIDFDQSVFVRAAMKSVLREAVIASILVSLMVLVFLGSWRSMIMVSTSIPLAILVGVLGLFLAGQTFNIMTLGGLALAIGMLVDDATVEVENIHRNRLHGKAADRGHPRRRAPDRRARARGHAHHLHRVLPGGAAGRARALPLHAARADASSSRCSPRTCSRGRWCRRSRACSWSSEHHGERARPLQRVARRRVRNVSQALTDGRSKRCCTTAASCCSARWSSCIATAFLPRVVGLDFFPERRRGPDAPPLPRADRHAHRGDRALVQQLEDKIRAIIPADELETINDNIGIAGLLQPRVRAHRQHRLAGRGDPGRAQAGARADARVHAADPRGGPALASPASHVLLPVGRTS